MNGDSNSKNEIESTTETTTEVEATKAPSVKQVVTPPDKTGIADRLDKAVKAAKPVNRSPDLVPLNQDFDMMRRKLKALILSAKKYRDAMIHLDKARMDMALKYSVLSTKSPIFHAIGNTISGDPAATVAQAMIHLDKTRANMADHATKSPIAQPIEVIIGGDSLATVSQAASKVAHDFAKSYEDKVIDYCIEWERIVSTRVDAEVKETKKLNERLDHYQSKIIGLRTKSDAMNEKGKKSPVRMTEKLTRNEKKLDQAWRAYEHSASMLCNLLEEITANGWKDLYPLVQASMQWEVERAAGEYDVIAKLPAVMDDLIDAFEKGSSPPVQDVLQVLISMADVPIAMADDDVDSATTGSFHDEVNLEEAPTAPNCNLTSTVKDDTPSPKAVEPTSPKAVEHV